MSQVAICYRLVSVCKMSLNYTLLKGTEAVRCEA